MSDGISCTESNAGEGEHGDKRIKGTAKKSMLRPPICLHVSTKSLKATSELELILELTAAMDSRRGKCL